LRTQEQQQTQQLTKQQSIDIQSDLQMHGDTMILKELQQQSTAADHQLVNVIQQQRHAATQ
jgi:hypothetical protein